MADRDLLQVLADEAVQFFEWAGEAIADPLARDAILRDLGLPASPAPGPAPAPLPAGRLDAIRTYRDSANPTNEAGISALADIAVYLDAVMAELEGLADAVDEGGAEGVVAVLEERAHLILQLMASNFVRLRYPRVFLLFEAISTVEELTSTYGPGNNSFVDVWKSVTALIGFVWQPGKSVEQLAGNTTRGATIPLLEFAVRVGAIVFAALDMDDEDKFAYIQDILTGWDGRGVDTAAPEPPRMSDVVAGRMTSVAMGINSQGTSEELAAEARIALTIAFIHEIEGGPGLFLSLGGSGAFVQPVDRTWTYSLKARMEPAVSIAVFPNHPMPEFEGEGADDFELTASVAAKPREPTEEDPAPPEVALWFPARAGTRLEIGHVDFAISANQDRLEERMTVTGAAMVLDAKDKDGFLAELLGNVPLRLPFNFVLGYSTSEGLIRYGSFGGTAATAPVGGQGGGRSPVFAVAIPVGRAIGNVTIHEVALRLTRGPADPPDAPVTRHTLEVDASFSAQIGPAYVRVDQLGVQLALDNGKPPAERNLGLVDLDVGGKFPRGIAINVETDLVSGGGSLMHDPDQGIYFGILNLAFRGGMTMQAICLAATRNPDGTKGFSLVAILTFELAQPWPLTMGFYLLGFGGLVAVHRTFDEVAMRAALPTGQLRNVLFPVDPVHHTTEILTALQMLFPVRRGSVIVGLLAKLGWASPTLVQFEIALMYEFGRDRLILLGRVSATLPRPDLAVIKLNMDAVGVLDSGAGTVALDAVLYDSKLCDRFVVTGAMAMRSAWKGEGGLALAVGGLHPKFTVPAGFPSVARLQLALTDGDNPKLLCRAYFAVTSNTVQFGADASLYASAWGFSIEGEIGFDVLIQLLPPHFLADFRASVQLKRGSRNLFKVTVSGELEGPLPLRVAGKATFEILWCDHSVSFNKTLVDGGTPNDIVPIDALAILIDAMSDAKAWQTLLPTGSSQLVSIRQAKIDGLLLHPLGSLTVRQTVVPLELTEGIDRVGVATPTGARKFTITAAAIGAEPQRWDGVSELFAPAQFFDMTDDEKLAAPSFQAMDAGVTFGDGAHTFGPATSSPFDYTDIVIGADGEPVLEVPPVVVHRNVLELIHLSAVERSSVRRSLDRRFAAPVRPTAPRLKATGWAVVEPGVGPAEPPGGGPGPAVAPVVEPTRAAPPTWIEARRRATDGVKVVVPIAEVVR